MDAIAKSIEGGYVFLLIAQVLMVTGLVTTLLYLTFRRVREAYSNSPVAIPVAAEATPAESARISQDEVAKYETRIKALTEEVEQLKKNGTAATGAPTTSELQEKVKFLEAKLVEYEILQEEISTLITLKSENEKLRGELEALKSQPTTAASGPAPIQKAG